MCVRKGEVFSPFLSRAFRFGCTTTTTKTDFDDKKSMAKKGRAARILNALHKVNGTMQSEALKRRERKRPSKEFGNARRTTRRRRQKNRSGGRKSKKRERYEGGERAHHGAMQRSCSETGDFSFSVALVTVANGDGGNLVCTGLEKNVDEKTKELVEVLLDAGAKVAHGVDVSKRFDEDVGAALFESNSSSTKISKTKKMDRVYFNFPDCGFGAMASLAPTRIANERKVVRIHIREKFGTFESERRITGDLF